MPPVQPLAALAALATLPDVPVPPAARAKRTVLVPAVLLVAGTVALVGLAAPGAKPDVVRVTAAAATSSIVDLSFATATKRLDLLDGPVTGKAAPAPAPAKPVAQRATRSRTRSAAPVRKAVVRSGYFRPNGGGISSYYGMRWGRLHKGVDFNGSYGSPVRAVTSGRVISAGYDGGYGNLVQIRHSDGIVTAYAHMSRILVRGGTVEAGETIGLVGSTGNSTGPHLHFEVRTGGGQMNPLPWLRQRGVRV